MTKIMRSGKVEGISKNAVYLTKCSLNETEIQFWNFSWVGAFFILKNLLGKTESPFE